MTSARFSKMCALAVIATGGALAVGLAATLPAELATHFAGSGGVDGRMSRVGFAATMLILCFGLPLALLFGLSALRAPPRPSTPASGQYSVYRAKSASAIDPWAAASFASAFSAFMDFVAWRVWCANRSDPPALSAGGLAPAVVVFVCFIAAWAVAVSARRRP